MEGLDAFTTKAFDMVTSGKIVDALDLKKEEPKTRDRYKGVERFLTARRLIEAGVGCVTLSIGGLGHARQELRDLEEQLPQVDQGLANLVQDLHDSGLANDVSVVMWGEFGRTPARQQERRSRSLAPGHVGWSPVAVSRWAS